MKAPLSAGSFTTRADAEDVEPRTDSTAAGFARILREQTALPIARDEAEKLAQAIETAADDDTLLATVVSSVRAILSRIEASSPQSDELASRQGGDPSTATAERGYIATSTRRETLNQLTACELESERLVLVPLRPEHADELAPVLDDVALHRFIGGAPVDATELRARFTRQAGGRSPDGRERWLNWAVRERASGATVGTMQATVTPADRLAELAWVIGTAHQGRGYAKEAAALVAAWLRGAGVRRQRAHVHPEHDASAAVARSIGLQPTDAIEDGEVRWESPPQET